MNSITKYFILISMVAVLAGCQKDFLQMPTSSATTLDSVFSTAIKAQGAISNAYRRAIPQGLPFANTWNAMIPENLSGAMNFGFSWTISRNIILNGMNANSTNTDMDGYNNNFPSIRQCYLVKENIDKVKDMSAD